jgi:hypothetical protein
VRAERVWWRSLSRCVPLALFLLITVTTLTHPHNLSLPLLTSLSTYVRTRRHRFGTHNGSCTCVRVGHMSRTDQGGMRCPSAVVQSHRPNLFHCPHPPTPPTRRRKHSSCAWCVEPTKTFVRGHVPCHHAHPSGRPWCPQCARVRLWTTTDLSSLCVVVVVTVSTHLASCEPVTRLHQTSAGSSCISPFLQAHQPD